MISGGFNRKDVKAAKAHTNISSKKLETDDSGDYFNRPVSNLEDKRKVELTEIGTICSFPRPYLIHHLETLTVYIKYKNMS